jgi:hypothetical protein
MARTVYEVYPSGEQWGVKRRGAERADSLWDTKPPAIDRGAALARANEPSQLIIRRRDGTIEDERTCGDDPYPPQG